MTELSDIDLAVFYDGDKKERFDFRVTILGRVGNEFDIRTFQDLPLTSGTILCLPAMLFITRATGKYSALL